MNIEAYNLDSLRKLVRALQAESRSSSLIKSLRFVSSLCFGEERMYLPKGRRMAISGL